MKRLLSWSLLAAMTLSMAACGAPDPSAADSGATSGDAATAVTVAQTGLPIVEEQQELDVLVVATHPDIDPSEIVLVQKVMEETNVKINYEIISEIAWPEQKGLVLSRSELPDIMLGDKIFTDADMLNMASAGQIVSISDYSDYTPNFNSLMAEDDTLQADLTAPDGNIWAFPNYISNAPNEDGEIGSGVFTTQRVAYINQEWLDYLGLPMPTTTEELEETLIAFRDGDPNQNGLKDEIPMTGHQTSTFYYDDFFGAFGLDPHANANEVVYENIAMKDGKVVFSAMEPEYRTALEYFSSLWEQGLLDPETFSHDASMFKAKLQAEEKTVGVLTGWRTTAWRTPGSTDNTIYSVLPTLNVDDGGVYHQYFTGVRNRCAMVVTTNAENVELAVRWADNLLAEDNAYQWHSKQAIGYNIEMQDDGQFEWILPIEVDDPTFQKQVGYGYGITCVGTENQLRAPEDTDPLGVGIEKREADKYYVGTYPAIEDIYPKVFFTQEESDTIAQLGGEINLYIDQMYAEFITNGVTDDSWNAFVEQLNKMNVEEYIGAYQTAYDRYMAG